MEQEKHYAAISCIKQINIATDLIYKNYEGLITERNTLSEQIERYKEVIKDKDIIIQSLLKSNSALRGHFNRVKKELTKIKKTAIFGAE